MSLTRVLSNLNPMLTRYCSVGALLVLLALPAVAQQTTNLALPPGRLLFIVDTSLSMRGRADGIQYVMESLLASGLNGRLRPGDTIGLWTFNDAVHAGKFPLHSWSPTARETVITNVVRFLKQQRYEKKADLDKVLTQAFPLVRDSAIITLVLISDGASPMHGTPFDEAINTTFKEAGREQKRVRMPFVTVLRAERGKIVSGVVGQPPWPIDIPMLPCEQKALAAAKSPPPKPVTNAPPPKVASTKPRETIVIAKPATNAPAPTTEVKSAPAPTETPKPDLTAARPAPVPMPQPALAEKPTEPVPAAKPPAPTTVTLETQAKEESKPTVVPSLTAQVPPAVSPANSQSLPASDPGKPPAVTQTTPTPTAELPKPVAVAADTNPAKVQSPDPAAPAKQTAPVHQAGTAEHKAEAKPIAPEAKSSDQSPKSANAAPPAPSVPPPLTVPAVTATVPAVVELPTTFASNASSPKPTPAQTALASPAQPFLSGPRLLVIGLLLLGVAGILLFLIVRRTQTGPVHGSLITQSFDRDKDQP